MCWLENCVSHTLKKFLTLSQTDPCIYVSAVHIFWKHCGKKYARNKQFLLFAVFSTLFVNFLPFSSILRLSSANSSNLEESKFVVWKKAYEWKLWQKMCRLLRDIEPYTRRQNLTVSNDKSLDVPFEIQSICRWRYKCSSNNDFCLSWDRKHCGKKEKMLIISIFSFYHNVFKCFFLQGRWKSGLCATWRIKPGPNWKHLQTTNKCS